MEETLISQAVLDICRQAGSLETTRLQMFLAWLQSHHRVKEQVSADGLSTYLETWFRAMETQGILWEYHLILDEIAWWCELSDERLFRLLKDGA